MYFTFKGMSRCRTMILNVMFVVTNLAGRCQLKTKTPYFVLNAAARSASFLPDFFMRAKGGGAALRGVVAAAEVATVVAAAGNTE